jgi:hypothetical protein
VRGKQAKAPLPVRADRILRRLKTVRGISEDEKALHALGIAATPEERGELVRNYVQLYGCSSHRKYKRFQRIAASLSAAKQQRRQSTPKTARKRTGKSSRM